METGSPRKIQFTVPLLDMHLDPEAAEQFLVEHHLYRQQQQQQQGGGGGDECSSESCLSDRPSPESQTPTADELPCDEEFSAEVTAEAFEKLRCQMEGLVALVGLVGWWWHHFGELVIMASTCFFCVLVNRSPGVD
ncbi:hypothetical protein NHX12_030591 [Muraenolepis orangiensis]|uniref:Protein phosphatase 1 regulatory subunit 1A n=1 Tax=Muraenolepis orangiensis TaxID=630683 RepID=A0A9Q0IN07_9TELE|nr:hypothetical protein NHX12_030591 [Muraenolepis orangiensis]